MDTHQNLINQGQDVGMAQASSIVFQAQSAVHLTHITNSFNHDDPYEKFAIHFQLPSAIIWQIKFILSGVQSKKSVTTASQEFANLSEGYGRDFDKYLIKELLEQIDLKDSSKASKDKTESVKITLLNQEINRASLKPEFLTYFSEILQSIYGIDQSKQKASEFLSEMTKRLKLSAQTQILICLSMFESTDDESTIEEIIKIFRQKLIDYHVNGKPDQLPEYAVHRILYLFDSVNALQLDAQLKEPKQLILETIANRYSQFTPLRSSLHQDVSQSNSHTDLPSIHLLRDGGGLENLEFANKILQPWEILIDIGHNISYMYDFLLKTLSEFKGIDEKVMAQTILHLSLNYQGRDDHISKIIYNTFESNINGNSASIKKEPEDKKNTMTWSIDNLARAFRELYTNLNWLKVFESFGELEDEDLPSQVLEQGIDLKQFQTLCQIFNKSKPQNIQFPLQNLLSNQWKSPILQLTFIKGCISAYIQKKDKSISFNKLKNRAPTIPELQDMKERGETQESIEVWQCVDLVERLVILSENQGLFTACRRTFENPIKLLPEYLLISLCMAKPYVGNILLDELLSNLLPLFLGDHLNSSIVLQQLFKSNSSLFIRGICELCKHDQKLMNLSRVLDITQEVKQSLIPIVYCEDYDFAVNLGILAGKRDFLHYDVWIKSRLKDVGTPFIDALLKYINDHIITPVSDFSSRNQQLAESNLDSFEMQKNQILEKSHLTKDKLLLTAEHLKNSTLGQNEKVERDSINQINELNNKIRELFPQQQEPVQNSEEIDAAANEHFQRVFSAEDNEVDKRIEELIQTMQNFKESSDIKEQEIYACMLHGLFDEYRFLHRYPQQYLTKIAKLFGAIIKNNLLDRVLQDIALKFVIEAFRRDGRRQKFGIIVIKSFFDRLHKFPKFLEDIYQIRQSIQNTEPQMMMDIERLYLESKSSQNLQNRLANDFPQLPQNESQVSAFATDETKLNTNDFIISTANEIDKASQFQQQFVSNNISQQQQQQFQMQQKNSTPTQQSIQNNSNVSNNNLLPSGSQNQKDFQKKVQQNQRGQPISVQQNTNQQTVSHIPVDSRMAQKNQKFPNQGSKQMIGQPQQQSNQSIQQDQIYKSMTPPTINSQHREFIPTNRGPQQQYGGIAPQIPNQQFQQLPQQTKAFIPSNYPQTLSMQQPSPLVDHLPQTNVPPLKYNINQQQQNDQKQTITGGLSINSIEFQRPLSNSNMGLNISYNPPKQQEINIHSKEFQPSRLIYNDNPFSFSSKNQINQQQIQELVEYQQKINEKIKKAIDQGSKIRLDDLLDDETIKVENEYVEDQMRIICNNTGKGNFKQKIEELKKFVIKKPQKFDAEGKEIIDEKSARAEDHLRWLIHYIISKRLGVQSMQLQGIYIEILRELNHSVPRNAKSLTVIGLTLTQSQLVFKKCLVIDEDEFMKATNVAQGSSSLIRGYLQSLGSFIGSLTLAKNESIRTIHLDLKQILVEGSQIKNSRLPIAFVCRILKEIKQSKLFTSKNPWIRSLLQILKEIYENSQQLNSQLGNSIINSDNIMEIDSLFTALNIQNSLDIKPHGIISVFQNSSALLDQTIRRELEFIYKKYKIILPIQQSPQNNVQEEQKQSASFQQLSSQVSRLNIQQNQQNKQFFLDQQQDYDQNAMREALEKREQQMFQISQAVKVSDELVQIFQRYYNSSEQIIRKLVGKAVDDSIVEILPPVVDRSVTIALITTRELVLKDFAHDGDYQRVLKAADLIVQNLAGSLALVTCREPLRMSLTTNLKKIFEQHFKSDLGLNIIPVIQRHSDSTLSSDNTPDLNNLNRENEHLTSITEEQINETAVLASRENLELGCKLIKKEVIEKALKKVREDSQIFQAVEKRKRSEELGIKQYRDENIVLQFQELPPQLQPNQNGLTTAQFQVYADFEKLGQSQRDGEVSNSRIWQNNSASQPSSAQPSQIQNPQNLTQILKLIDQYGLTDINKEYLIQKINQMNQGTSTDEEKEKLWTYVQRNLEIACKNYDGNNSQNVDSIIEVLSLIVKSYKLEDFSKKLLTGVYLQLDVRIFNDVDLNILLMSKEIISISEWDQQLALFFKESAAQLPESELQFFSRFLEASIIDKKILTKESVPQLIYVMERMQTDKKIGKFCQSVLETLNSNSAAGQQSQEIDQDQLMLKEFFIRWVIMSYIEDKENQERQINTFFQELEALNIVGDQKLLYSFCKVMIQTSIERAILFGDTGETRPADRLDFRYIDSFVKLIVVLLKQFIQNKHEFITKILDLIGEALDQDHKTKKALFNQRPYYRMIMNILTAVNLSGCFNPKTQLLVLFSMADLYKMLNPSQYPAFCFAWLELVSHKQFLPHFLRGSSNAILGGTSPVISQQMVGTLGQQQFPGFQNLQGLSSGNQEGTFYQKRFKIKELIECMLIFLKNNLIPGQQTPPVIQAFYHATLRVINVIKQDFPDFLSDFHFNFVNSLPEHSIQLRNMILSATPQNIQLPDPFSRELKIDLLLEMKQSPRILSNYDSYLSIMNLREDLENYTRSRNPHLITEICRKIEQCEEIVNGRRRINQNVVSALVLFIANWNASKKNAQESQREEHREARDTIKQIVKTLGDEARLCFLNAIVNELRYPNNHTFYFSCIILFIYAEADKDIIYEQISAIFLERLQCQGPYPWGLMISFRELIQIPKFQFMKRQYIRSHPQAINKLFSGQLRNFLDFIPQNLLNQMMVVNPSQNTDTLA